MFKFYGAKHTLAPSYPAPLHSTIVEPFAGAAGYSVHHRSTARVILYEKDQAIVSLWERLLGMDVSELLAVPDPVPGDMSSDILVALAAGRTTRDTPEKFTVSARMAQRYRPMVRRIASVLDECRHFEVHCGEYTMAPDIEATWYIDPPYHHPGGDARWDRSRGGRYLHSNRDIDYPALAEWARARPGQVIVCEQEGAPWMDWTHTLSARDSQHKAYGEVYWYRTGREA